MDDGKVTGSAAQGPLKPRLLALLAQGRAEQKAFIEKLSAAERAVIGAPEAWAAKDHVAHNAAWKADAAREISATLRGDAYIPESTTTFNPRVFAEQQHQSWEAILVDTQRADEALHTAVEGSSEAGLTDAEPFPWREGVPLWCTALVSGYEHPAEHYAQFYLASGDVSNARSVREKVVETARRYLGETEQFGYIVYNLGCFYAGIGQSDLAVAALREAFAHVPQLRDGIKEDPELASLRDEPAFQALAEAK